MIVGTTMFKLDGNPYHSPEFPRGGLAATFSVDVTHLQSTAGWTITVQTRNSEDTAWTTLGTFSAITATGVATLDLTGMKEIVRFSFDFDAADGANAAVHFLMQAPSWRPY